MKETDLSESIALWYPLEREWDPDPYKPFFVEVLKKAVYTKMVDFVFLRHFKNSLAIMCEAWLKRKGIDPTINTSKNFHTLQDEFFKVLAHINRGFERSVEADWRAAIGVLISLRNNIKNAPEARWFDHQGERRMGDPASRFELVEEPKQDCADSFWIGMFKRGMKIKMDTLATARHIDGRQARFFASVFDIDEHKTFTETTLSIITDTQESWLTTTLSSKLGIKRGLDFEEETIAASLKQLRNAERVILDGNARLWLINEFFRLYKRRWKYLLETLTGGHRALERLMGSVITTLAIDRHRRTFEVREDDAEELFNLLWNNDILLSPEHSEHILHQLHQAVINAEGYEIFTHVAVLCHALKVPEKNGDRFKSFATAEPVLTLFDSAVHAVIAYDLSDGEIDFSALKYPVTSQARYDFFLKKLKAFLKLEIEVHRVVEELFRYVTDTFSDLMQAYKIQKKKKITSKDKELLKKIAQKHHLLAEEGNFLAYAPDRCYIGRELQFFQRDGEETEKGPLRLRFKKKTQMVKKNYLTPPQGIRRELTKRCGRYGRLVGDLVEEQGEALHQVKMIWNPPKIQISDGNFQGAVKPRTVYEIIITRAEPRKARERWE